MDYKEIKNEISGKTQLIEEEANTDFIGFADSLAEAIENENIDQITELVGVSKSIKQGLNGQELPDYFFNQRLISGFFKIMNDEFLNNFYPPTIDIFYNLYFESNHHLMNFFYTNEFIKSLWHHVQNTRQSTLFFTMEIILSFAKTSLELGRQVFELMPPDIAHILIDVREKKQPIEYYIILIELLLYSSKFVFFNISVKDLLNAILLVFIYFKNQFIPDGFLFQAMSAFRTILETYNKGEIIEAFEGIDLEIYIMKYFYFCDDQSIFYHNVQLLSSLISLKYEAIVPNQPGNSFQKKLEFKYSGHHLIKAINELKIAFSLPKDDHNRLICEHLLNIIVSITKYFTGQIKHVSNYINPYKVFICEKMAFFVIDIFKTGEHTLMKKCFSLSYIMLDGPIVLIRTLLDNGIVDIIADFLESDDLYIITKAIKFIIKLTKTWNTPSLLDYPFIEDIQKYEILDTIEELILSEDIKIASQAQLAKNFIDTLINDVSERNQHI
ncbi:hypothetical protein TRFO_17277 [Tritrichomonas foetus]|uniref:Uncharacterized protein n=1 Tax=Tritrichomonas foetus TaxID=1144522 RepID=A0A1J4KT18_9EUKA|nr:hypothetical protein TRFO_17277 [Tritrichomonas foetus]|eukprot:OHT12806.1 hypothetical protein TRFO_17277 [Tritrichomonas foetus]